MVENAIPGTLDEWLKKHPDIEREFISEAQKRVDTVGFDAKDMDKFYNRFQKQQKAKNKQNENTKSREITQTLKTAEGDLSKLNFDEIAVAWSVLKDAGEKDKDKSKLRKKMADFAETKMAEISQDTNFPLSMANAPEISEWLIISNESQTTGDKQKSARNAALNKRLTSFYQTYDKNNFLENLPSAEDITANDIELDAISKNFDPAEKNKEGKELYPEYLPVKTFYDNLIIENNGDKATRVDKNTFRADMDALARQETILELSINPKFKELNRENKKRIFAAGYFAHMEQGILSLTATQMAANAEAQKPGGKFNKGELYEQARDYFQKITDGKAGKISISNVTAVAVLAERTSNLTAKAKRIAQKTGAMAAWNRVKRFDKEMTRKHPLLYPAAKSFAESAAIGWVTGGVGLTVMSAIHAGSAINKSYINYKKNNNTNESYFSHLKKNKLKMINLAAAVGSAAISVYGISVDGLRANDFGKLGTVIAGNTPPLAAATTSAATGLWGAISDNLKNPQKLARLALSIGSGVSRGTIYMAQSFAEKDETKKKELRKKAGAVAVGGLIGAFVGLTAGPLLSEGTKAVGEGIELPDPSKSSSTDIAMEDSTILEQEPVNGPSAPEHSETGQEQEAPQTPTRDTHTVHHEDRQENSTPEETPRQKSEIRSETAPAAAPETPPEEVVVETVEVSHLKSFETGVKIAEDFEQSNNLPRSAGKILSEEIKAGNLTKAEATSILDNLKRHAVEVKDYKLGLDNFLKEEDSLASGERLLQESAEATVQPEPPAASAEPAADEISEPVSTIPSHRQMFEMNEKVIEAYRQTQNFETSVINVLNQEVEAGNLTEAQKSTAVKIYGEVVSDHNGKIKKALEDIRFNSHKMAIEEELIAEAKEKDITPPHEENRQNKLDELRGVAQTPTDTQAPAGQPQQTKDGGYIVEQNEAARKGEKFGRAYTVKVPAGKEIS